MVALSPVSLVMSALAMPRPASSADVDGGFAQALAALGGGGDETPPALPQRQEDSDDGKSLPDAAADPAAAASLDPRLLWLPAGLLPTAPVVAPGGGVSKPVPQPIAIPVTAATDPQTVLTKADAAPSDTSSSEAPNQIASGVTAFQGKLAELLHPVARVATPHIAPVPVAVPIRLQPAPAITSAAASEVAVLGLDPTVPDRKRPVADPVIQQTTLTTEVALQNAVQPTGDTRHVPLDLRGDDGLQKMIDHIETLRDGADANDTRIRLVPDALGGVDVAVRRSGDAVHVHFTAETEATRALLTEAQPRLVELADQRGVRIAGATVDTGTGGAGSGGGGQPPQPHRAPAPITNVSVSPAIEATGEDARLA